MNAPIFELWLDVRAIVGFGRVSMTVTDLLDDSRPVVQLKFAAQWRDCLATLPEKFYDLSMLCDNRRLIAGVIGEQLREALRTVICEKYGLVGSALQRAVEA